MTLAVRPPSRSPSNPPTAMEEIKQFCLKVAPGNLFGLAIYSFQLARGTLAPELRKTISIALAIGWLTAAIVAGTVFEFSPADVSLTYRITATLCFSFWAMVLGGLFVYNRVKYGSYL